MHLDHSKHHRNYEQIDTVAGQHGASNATVAEARTKPTANHHHQITIASTNVATHPTIMRKISWTTPATLRFHFIRFMSFDELFFGELTLVETFYNSSSLLLYCFSSGINLVSSFCDASGDYSS